MIPSLASLGTPTRTSAQRPRTLARSPLLVFTRTSCLSCTRCMPTARAHSHVYPLALLSRLIVTHVNIRVYPLPLPTRSFAHRLRYASFTHSHVYSHSIARMLTLTHSFALSRVCSHTLARILTLTRSFTLSRVYSHSLTRSPTLTSAHHLLLRVCVTSIQIYA